MRTTLVPVISVVITAGLCGMAGAGNIDSSVAPSSGSGMYTLQQVYDYLYAGTMPTIPGSFQEPSASPASTMKTTKQLIEVVATLFAQCPATAADVKSGVKFFSTVSGSWGVQTGTGTWYDQYGPSGPEDKVVQIGSLYVAKYTNNAGTDTNATKTWTTAGSWGTDLVWLGKDDWRLPHQGELEAVCADKMRLGAYAVSPARYWTVDPFTGSTGVEVPFDTCTSAGRGRTVSQYVRAVRSVD